MELLCCLGWFNPFFHLVKKELKVLHEFLADEHTAGRDSRYDYAELLVLQAIRQKDAGPSLSHPFSYHPIKRRIMMLTTKHSMHRRRGYFSRAMVLPLLLLLLGAFALRPVYTHHPAVAAASPISVIIDAGHGGVDPGATVDNVHEKDIALSLAQKVKALAPQYNVRVIMTRETDELPGGGTNIQAGLRKRTEIAEQTNAAMFISLHVNLSAGESPMPAGFEAYIASRKEDKNNQLLASSLLQQLGSVYTAAPDIKKRSKGIWVLEQNPRPAVLLECGNLSVPADRKFITDEKNQENVAKMILQGIVNYSKL